jgi:acyl carrier protein
VTTDRVREIIAGHARLAVEVSTLADTDDLYRAGMTSHASVNLMLALEDEFGVTFPDELLRRETFGSVAAISEAVTQLAASNV